MIDRTSDFREAVRLAGQKETRKAPQLIRREARTKFGKDIKTISTNIRKLQDFLSENKSAYVGSFSSEKKFSDNDRDKLENDCTRMIQLYAESISILKSSILSSVETKQSLMHKQNAIILLENYFKAVSESYNELRAIRIRDIVEKKKLTRLEFDSSKSFNLNKTPCEDEQLIPAAYTSEKFKKYLYDDSDDEITAEDAAHFERESEQMLTKANDMSEAVKSIEGKVVEIARLQNMFNEQVYQQEENIELVADTIVESSENINRGNESLREAMRNNTSRRVWILFFLVMCSFSLLFLEWYS